MTFLEFMGRNVGPKWVIARRTSRVLAHYPDSVFLSKQKYDALQKRYRAEWGDPYDKVRAELYCSLLEAREQLDSSCNADTLALCKRIDAALEAERNAR